MRAPVPLPDPETEPGARLPSEPAAAFAAFVIFRDLGASRSVPKAYRHNQGNTEAKSGQASGCWNAWAREYRWRERAEEWDRHLDRQARLAQVDAVKAMNSRQTRYAIAMQQKGISALLKLKAEEITAAEAQRLLTEGAKLERVALGQAAEIVRNEQAGESKTELVIVEKIVTTRAEARGDIPALPPVAGGADILPDSENGPPAALGPPGGAAHEKAGPAGSLEPGKALLDFDLPDDPPAP